MNLKLQLKILSFLQFCLWGSWLTTLGSYMFVTLKFDGASIGAVYSSLGIAAVLMPTLLDKPERRRVPLHVDYSGFTIPDEFVVGYGLDYAEKYRNLPDIGVLRPEIYE